MYRIFIIDKGAELPVSSARSQHLHRVPNIGEHVMLKWQEETKVCEVEDVWTNVNLDHNPPYQGAVQVVVRWNKGLEPSLYFRRFR